MITLAEPIFTESTSPAAMSFQVNALLMPTSLDHSSTRQPDFVGLTGAPRSLNRFLRRLFNVSTSVAVGGPQWPTLRTGGLIDKAVDRLASISLIQAFDQPGWVNKPDFPTYLFNRHRVCGDIGKWR